MDGLNESQKVMAESNLNLVRFALKKLGIRRGDSRYDDLFSTGCVALCTASLCYRPGKGAFSTYAFHVIRHELIRLIKKDRRDAFKTVSLESGCAGLAVRESGYEAVEAALLVGAFFRYAGLASPDKAGTDKTAAGGPPPAENERKSRRADFEAWLREGK